MKAKQRGFQAAGLLFGFMALWAHASPIVYLPFQDANGNYTTNNFGTVGTVVAADGVMTNNTPPLVGGAYAHYLTGLNNRILLDADTLDGFASINMETAGQEITIAAWIYIDSIKPTTDHGIANMMRSDMQGGWTFLVDRGSGELLFRIGNNDLEEVYQRHSVDTVSTGEWTHVAMTWVAGDGVDALKFYFNGVETSSYRTPFGDDIPDGFLARKSNNNYKNLGIGARHDSGNQSLDGIMDEVFVYNSVLAASEIQALIPEPGTLGVAGLAGLVLLWRRRRRCG